MTVALDLFAGTGWGVACQALGIEEHGVELMPAAVATREANGMRTAYRDVWEGLDRPELVPEHDLLIASPPCQTFSLAGAGAGRRALTEVVELIEDGTWLDPAALRAFGAEHDDRTALVLTPLTYAMRYRPRAIVLEQVPPVLPVWHAIARVLAMNGYQVDTGVLHAEAYGVPQTRKRAILVARRGAPVALPAATHSRYYPTAPDRRDPGVLPWVSMAQALGWGMTRRPYLTVAPGTASGGTDPPALGGSGARAILHGERDAGRWHRWPFVRPATTIVGSFDPHIVRAPGHTAAKGDLGHDPKVHSQNSGEVVRVTVEEAAALQSYPPGFVWVGTKTTTFQQVGNAVPPLLALRVLEAVAPATAVTD